MSLSLPSSALLNQQSLFLKTKSKFEIYRPRSLYKKRYNWLITKMTHHGILITGWHHIVLANYDTSLNQIWAHVVTVYMYELDTHIGRWFNLTRLRCEQLFKHLSETFSLTRGNWVNRSWRNTIPTTVRSSSLYTITFYCLSF